MQLLKLILNAVDFSPCSHTILQFGSVVFLNSRNPARLKELPTTQPIFNNYQRVVGLNGLYHPTFIYRLSHDP